MSSGQAFDGLLRALGVEAEAGDDDGDARPAGGNGGARIGVERGHAGARHARDGAELGFLDQIGIDGGRIEHGKAAGVAAGDGHVLERDHVRIGGDGAPCRC